MNSHKFHSLLVQSARSHFETSHLCLQQVSHYRYSEGTFRSECIVALQSIPEGVPLSSWLRENIFKIGTLPVSLIYSRLVKNGEHKTASKIVAHLEELREESDTSDESTESYSSSEELESGLFSRLREVYTTSFKPEILEAVTGLQAPAPAGMRFTKDRIEKDRESANSLLEGMKRFEALTDK